MSAGESAPGKYLIKRMHNIFTFGMASPLFAIGDGRFASMALASTGIGTGGEGTAGHSDFERCEEWNRGGSSASEAPAGVFAETVLKSKCPVGIGQV